MTKIDEHGTWEVIEGEGCINRTLIDPSPGYEPDNAGQQFDVAQRIEEMAEQLMLAQEALDFLIMGGM